MLKKLLGVVLMSSPFLFVIFFGARLLEISVFMMAAMFSFASLFLVLVVDLLVLAVTIVEIGQRLYQDKPLTYEGEK